MRMRLVSISSLNASASSSRSNRQTAWMSSDVVSSIPATGMIPYRRAAAKNAGQFLELLWSVRAIMRTPLRNAMPARLLGVLSASPQGERQEWTWKS